MPSPLGHAMGGLAAGLLITGNAGVGRHLWRAGLAFALAATAPDLDLLVGFHRGPTHSLGAACIAGLLAGAVTREVRFGLAVGLAWATHPLLDALGEDTRPPLGVMAFWPLSTEFHLAPVQIFPAISRRYWFIESWFSNARAVLVEILWMAPFIGLTWLRLRTENPRTENPRTQNLRTPEP